MNPIDWLAWVYGRFFVGYPLWTGYVVMCIGGAAVAALLWTKAIDSHNASPLQTPKTAAEAVAGSSTETTPTLQAPNEIKAKDGPKPVLPAVVTPVKPRTGRVARAGAPNAGSASQTGDTKPAEKEAQPQINQKSEGANSPNVVTLGPNSPVTITNAPPPWGLDNGGLQQVARAMSLFAEPTRERGDLITCIWGDTEATRFAEDLVGAFRAAGWNLPGSGYNRAVYDADFDGVRIVLRTGTSRPPGFNELLAVLRRAKIETNGEVDATLPEREFRIKVGRRPR